MAAAAMPPFDDDVWELTTDWTQSKDLSKDNPQKLHEQRRLWLIEAVKYNVLRSMTDGPSASSPRWPGGSS
jgi:arylsulfatase A-like enzyme